MLWFSPAYNPVKLLSYQKSSISNLRKLFNRFAINFSLGAGSDFGKKSVATKAKTAVTEKMTKAGVKSRSTEADVSENWSSRKPTANAKIAQPIVPNTLFAPYDVGIGEAMTVLNAIASAKHPTPAYPNQAIANKIPVDQNCVVHRTETGTSDDGKLFPEQVQLVKLPNVSLRIRERSVELIEQIDSPFDWLKKLVDRLANKNVEFSQVTLRIGESELLGILRGGTK